MGDLPDFQEYMGWYCTESQDIIIATDGPVLFGVGYHSWLVTTTKEDILLAGGGPDDNPQNRVTSYRSELGGITAGMGVMGTLARSGWIAIRSVKFMCNNSVANLARSSGLIMSVFNCTESDYNLIATIKYL
jgi:hypothetical protein